MSSRHCHSFCTCSPRASPTNSPTQSPHLDPSSSPESSPQTSPESGCESVPLPSYPSITALMQMPPRSPSSPISRTNRQRNNSSPDTQPQLTPQHLLMHPDNPFAFSCEHYRIKSHASVSSAGSSATSTSSGAASPSLETSRDRPPSSSNLIQQMYAQSVEENTEEKATEQEVHADAQNDKNHEAAEPSIVNMFQDFETTNMMCGLCERLFPIKELYLSLFLDYTNCVACKNCRNIMERDKLENRPVRYFEISALGTNSIIEQLCSARFFCEEPAASISLLHNDETQ